MISNVISSKAKRGSAKFNFMFKNPIQWIFSGKIKVVVVISRIFESNFIGFDFQTPSTGDSNLKSPSATTSITADDILCKVIPKANGELLLPQAYSKPRGVTSRFYLPDIGERGGESKNDFA